MELKVECLFNGEQGEKGDHRVMNKIDNYLEDFFCKVESSLIDI